MNKQGINSVINGGALSRFNNISNDNLSPSHRKIKSYIEKNTEEVVKMSITSLANECGVSEATVIRFCQAFKFNGFQELKLNLARELNNMDNINTKISRNDDITVVAKKVLLNQKQLLDNTLQNLDIINVQEVIKHIIEADQILFVGMGSSGSIALEAKNMFLRIGLKADYISDPHIANVKAATLSDRDVVIGISSSGSTKDTVQCLAVAKENSNPYTVGITSHLQSPITKFVDNILLTSNYENPLAGGTLWSNLSQQFVIVLLFLGVTLKIDYIDETVIKTARSVVDKLY